jgi:hypothetical protein
VQLCLFYRFIFPSIVDSSQYDVFSEEVKYYGMKYVRADSLLDTLHLVCAAQVSKERSPD